MGIELFTHDGFFDPCMVGFTILNSYSTKGRSNNTRSVSADLIFLNFSTPVLTLCNLNIHQPTADPLRTFKEDELATTVPYFNRATELGYSLLNTPGVYTRLSMSLVSRPGVIDQAFACPLLTPYFSEWSDPLPSTGSDYIPILLRFDAPLIRAHPPPPNWALTDWGAVDAALKSLVIAAPRPLPTSVSLGTWFDTSLNRVSAQVTLHTPIKGITHWSKPWGSASLTVLRKAYTSAVRSSKEDSFDASLLVSAIAARSSYFKAINKAKRDHWSAFQATATPQPVWTAKRFAIGCPPPHFPELPGASTQLELNKARLATFFPRAPLGPTTSILHSFKNCPELVPTEVERALVRSSPSSAPGPDSIPNSVWKKINKTAPHLILKLLSPLVYYGLDPSSLKRADGIVLDKPGKPTYDSPSSFQVLVLLCTFSKILERMMNSRLSCVACMTGFLNPH